MLTTQQLRLNLFTGVFAVLLAVIHSFELPFLQTCTLEDEKCHMKQVDKFFDLYGNGIPELNVSTLDSIPLADAQIKGNPNANFNIQVDMHNMTLHNVPKMRCSSIKGFVKETDAPIRISSKLFASELILKGHCRIKGKLLFFKVEGDTDIEVSMRNSTIHAKVNCVPYTKDGKSYYKANELKPRLNIGSFSIIFSNSTLFNGESILMDTFASTVNQNWEIFSKEFEPAIIDAFSRVLIDALNKIYATIPLDRWFKASE